MGAAMSEDKCRPVDVDGEIIQVHGSVEMDDTDRAMFEEVVQAAKRRFAAEHPTPEAVE